MPEIPAIRLVVFDLGRVLIRICDDWGHACSRAGVQAPAHLTASAINSMNDLAHQHDIGKLDLAAFSIGAGELLGMSPEDFTLASNAFLHTAYPGGLELIDELNAAGVATACLSNTNESHWRMMGDPAHVSHVPLHRLTHRFASHLCGFRKPDPSIYAQVEKETGLPPASLIFFDDVEENVAGAIHRGWNAYRIDPRAQDPIALMRTELRRRRVLP